MQCRVSKLVQTNITEEITVGVSPTKIKREPPKAILFGGPSRA